MKRAAGCILRTFGSTKESFVKDVETPDIIGNRLNGNGNAQNVGSELRFEVEV